MRNALLMLLWFLIIFSSYGQKVKNDPVLENKLFKPYENYFARNPEWVYSHFNKSAYIQGDDIWFTSYVLNPANRRLNLNTSKLYVELWSPEKKLISRKILFVNSGTTNHFIHLPDSLAPGSYCFRTYTSWMRNFYPENDFNTLITVLGQQNMADNGLKVKQNEKGRASAEPKTSLKEIKQDYDIQFLPESGSFLEGVDNTLGVHATDPAGNGIKISGKVLNHDNEDVRIFSTNESGISNLLIPAVSPQLYHVKVTLPDSTTRDLELPKTESKGVIIQINPYRQDVIWFRIQTNEITRQLNKPYTIMVHANGILFKSYQIHFSQTNTVQFNINKKEMAGGIIYATVFDENLIPVAERLFYNFSRNIIDRGSLTINAQPIENDSVNLLIVLTDSLFKPQFAKLSLSILPGKTVLNHFKNNLLTESIFRPALRGTIENPNSYFEKYDIEHFIAIDNLLLTQGWRKYDWPTIINDTTHKFTYPFEEAFTIEGSVKNWIKNKPDLKSNITLLSPMNNIFLLEPVDNEGKFKFDRVFLNDSTWIIASASSDKGKNWNRTLQMTVPESFASTPNIQQSIKIPIKEKERFDTIPKLIKGNILLPEMVVRATKKSPFSDNIYVGMNDRTLELTKENYNQFHNLEMLLLIKFNVRTEKTQNGEYHFNMGRGITTFSGQKSEPQMMIDGMRINDAQEILNLPLELVGAVAVNKDGLGGGMEGSSGTIAIQSRTTPLFENNGDATNLKRLMVQGYSAPRKYFEPKYITTPGTSDYDKYASIFWKPDLVTDSTNTASFRFYVPREINTIAVHIEGISFEGKIFLHDQKITLPGRD